MANPQSAKALRDLIDQANDLKSRDLVRRPEWGSITFDNAQSDLDRIYGVLGHLKLLPVEDLTDQAMNEITSATNNVLSILKQVDSFTLERGSPPEARNSLVQEIHRTADALYSAAGPWIPYLAYVRGDVERNISALTRSVQNGQELVEDAKETISGKMSEIDAIITAAREASAAAGAAVFTRDFDTEATTLKTGALKWLQATAVFGGITTVLAIAAFFFVESGLDTGEIVQKSAARLAVLAIFFTATLWCGRIYKALLHQASINRHRALSLQTFQAFSRAAAEPATKDAVLMEATRAVFGPVPTGFLDGSGAASPQSTQVIEIARQFTAES